MSLCKQCGLEVRWLKIKGRWHCWNAGTETDHFDLCSKAKFERIKRTGVRFEGKRQDGYLTVFKPSGVQLTRDAAKPVRGSLYAPTGLCRDCVPPWEICEDCPDRLLARLRR